MQIGMKFATYARGCDKISFEASKNLDKTLPPYCAKDPFQMRGAVPEDSIRFCVEVVGVFFCNIVTYQSSRMERCFLHFAMFILAWTHYHKWQGKGAVVRSWCRISSWLRIQDTRAKPQGWSLVSSYTWNEAMWNATTWGWHFSTMFKFAKELNKTSSTCLPGRVFESLIMFERVRPPFKWNRLRVWCRCFMQIGVVTNLCTNAWSMLKQRLHQFVLSSNHMSPYNQKQTFPGKLHFEPHACSLGCTTFSPSCSWKNVSSSHP